MIDTTSAERSPLFRSRCRPGMAEVRHHHERAHQFFFVLAGEVTIDVDGAIEVLAASQGREVPPRADHLVSNNGSADAVFVVVRRRRATATG